MFLPSLTISTKNDSGTKRVFMHLAGFWSYYSLIQAHYSVCKVILVYSY